MGETAGATEQERARRRELAQAIVEAVENDESVAAAAGLLVSRTPEGVTTPVPAAEERLFALAQEIQQLTGGEIYLVVAQDRHIDNQHTLCLTRAAADAVVEDFKALYEETAWTETTYGQPEWVRNVHADCEGVKVRIERIGFA